MFKNKVNIVESKTPPTNKNDWWYDLNTSTLKRYTGGGWSTAVSDNPSEGEGSGEGEVIKTTYKEAKALYESGKMKKGVRYEFDCNQDRVFPGIAHVLETSCRIKVILNNDNTLKALGEQFYYGAQSYAFVADYTFDKMYVSYKDDYDHGILSTRKPIISVSFTLADDENFRASLADSLTEANIDFIASYDNDSIYTIHAINSIVWAEVKEVYNEENDDHHYVTHYYFYTKDKVVDVYMALDNPAYVVDILSETGFANSDGLLSNLTYFSYDNQGITKKHSYIFDGWIRDTGAGSFVRINCDIENDLDEYILAGEDIDVRGKGLIKHSILNAWSMVPSQPFNDLHLENSDLSISYQDTVSIKMIDSEAYFIGDLLKDVYLVNTRLTCPNLDEMYYDGSFVLGDLYYGATIDFANHPSDAEKIVDLRYVREYLMETIS